VKATGDHARAKIVSRDWGSYGDLQVFAVLKNGMVVPGRLKGGDNVAVIPVPLRKAGDRIGSAWDRKGRDEADDDEKSPDNANDGDGLDVYSEYRGVMTKTGHQRLDPDRKDLIVEDRSRLDLDLGLRRFEQASGIRVVRLAAGQLGARRVVDANA